MAILEIITEFLSKTTLRNIFSPLQRCCSTTRQHGKGALQHLTTTGLATMITILQGPHGTYIAAEGIEQNLFQIDNKIILFDSERCLSILKNCARYCDQDKLIEYLVHQNQATIVCTRNSTLFIGNRKIYDLRTTCHGKNVHAHLSITLITDFTDLVKHTPTTQFGFITNAGLNTIFAPTTQLVHGYPPVYNKRSLKEATYSVFATLLHESPSDLATFITNLCALDLTTPHDVSTITEHLARGTTYYTLYRQLQQCQQERDFYKHEFNEYVRTFQEALGTLEHRLERSLTK